MQLPPREIDRMSLWQFLDIFKEPEPEDRSAVLREMGIEGF